MILSRRKMLGTASIFCLAALSIPSTAPANHPSQFLFDPEVMFSPVIGKMANGRKDFNFEEAVKIGQADVYSDLKRRRATMAAWTKLKRYKSFEPNDKQLVDELVRDGYSLDSAKPLSLIFQSKNRFEAKQHIDEFLSATPSDVVASFFAPMVYILQLLGLQNDEITALLKQEFGSNLRFVISDDYQIGSMAQLTSTKDRDGINRVAMQSATQLETFISTRDQGPDEAAYGFWGWLGDIANKVANFYLDLMWNIFMGAAAGATLGGISSPFGGLLGAIVGANAGMWYTLGQRLTSGGFWLGPNGEDTGPCGSPILEGC